jgi:hypothetical protein
MANPLSFETEITRRRIVDEIESIEAEISSGGGPSYISEAGVRRLRELRLAMERKPLVEDGAKSRV